MRKSLRDAYNRELALLYDRAAEFAEEYPGIADRLGGLLRENTDPAIAGLLEGSAFLAARVQLKIGEEFRGFTHALLDQIFPDALAPTPSAMLVQARPDPSLDLSGGAHFPPHSYLDARFTDAEQRVACRFRLTSPLDLWPVAVTDTAYHRAPAAIGALGRDAAPRSLSAMTVDIDATQGTLASLGAAALTFHLTAPLPEAVAAAEQIHAQLTRASIRTETPSGDAVFHDLPLSPEQIGFTEEDRLLPHAAGLFDGYAELRESFIFPRKYLGFRITGLDRILPRLHGTRMQLVLEFDRAHPLLAERWGAGHIRLNCATAVNLFEENSAQVRLDEKRHEFVVTPDSAPVTHYEIYRLTEVFAHYAGQAKLPVHPLYDLPPGGQAPRHALYYTARTKPRRLTARERRFGTRHRYRGTETYIAVYEPPEKDAAQRLQIRALCTNRHLPGYLPIAESQNDFFLVDETNVTLACVAGPTEPKEPLVELEPDAPHRTQQGDVYWRLISYLSLSHFTLDDRSGRDAAASLREMLSLFADLSDSGTAKQIDGLQGLQTRRITRSIRRGGAYIPAHGLEIRLTFDETAFEGSGMFLMGMVLDRFLAEYAAINSFTQTVLISRQRGEVHTFPPRTGAGPLL